MRFDIYEDERLSPRGCILLDSDDQERRPFESVELAKVYWAEKQN